MSILGQRMGGGGGRGGKGGDGVVGNEWSRSPNSSAATSATHHILLVHYQHHISCQFVAAFQVQQSCGNRLPDDLGALEWSWGVGESSRAALLTSGHDVTMTSPAGCRSGQRHT